LFCHELVLLEPRDVTLVACQSAEEPCGTIGHLKGGSADDGQSLHSGKGVSNDGLDGNNVPWTTVAAYERTGCEFFQLAQLIEI
jgi:hypothetical protein